MEKYVKVFCDYLEIFGSMDDADVGRVIRAMMLYKRSGTDPDFEPSSVNGVVWRVLKAQLDREHENYERKVANAKSSAAKRRNRNQSQQSQSEQEKEQEQAEAKEMRSTKNTAPCTARGGDLPMPLPDDVDNSMDNSQMDATSSSLGGTIPPYIPPSVVVKAGDKTEDVRRLVMSRSNWGNVCPWCGSTSLVSTVSGRGKQCLPCSAMYLHGKWSRYYLGRTEYAKKPER